MLAIVPNNPYFQIFSRHVCRTQNLFSVKNLTIVNRLVFVSARFGTLKANLDF